MAGVDRITHVTWADNIVLLCNSAAEFRVMAQELTTALYNAGLKWKNGSLELLTCRDQPMGSESFQIVAPSGEEMIFQENTTSCSSASAWTVLAVLWQA